MFSCAVKKKTNVHTPFTLMICRMEVLELEVVCIFSDKQGKIPFQLLKSRELSCPWGTVYMKQDLERLHLCPGKG